jgi:hypothetical protein
LVAKFGDVFREKPTPGVTNAAESAVRDQHFVGYTYSQNGKGLLCREARCCGEHNQSEGYFRLTLTAPADR